MRGEHLKKHQFKPGQSGNINGRPKKPFTVQNIEKVFMELIGHTTSEIKEVVKDPKTPILTRIVAEQLLLAGSNSSNFNTIFDRIIGKVKDVSEVSMHNHDVVDNVIDKNRDGVLKLLRSVGEP